MNDILRRTIDKAFEGSPNKKEFLNKIEIYISKLSSSYENRDNLNVKLFLTDVDGVLTDAGMYYSENGDELKKFNTRDGKAFELLKKAGIKTGIITSENTKIVENRAKKLNVDYLYQGALNKLPIIEKICSQENISLKQVAYVGDDVNDELALTKVGFPSCPQNANTVIKQIPNINILESKGGEGAFREFVEHIIGKERIKGILKDL
jgi:YrbI family 3-deoxy-D-manno-octulosonate 8-phosphate phosphatase